MASYNQKVIVAGNLIQTYTYTKPIFKDYHQRHEKHRNDFGEKSLKSLYRLRNNIALTIESNITPFTKFLTLTTAEPIYDRVVLTDIFRDFKRKFKKSFGFDFKYVGVIEKQKERQKKFNLPDAPLHYHFVVFIDKFLPFEALKDLWGIYGSLDIKKVKNTEVSRYLMKYITKEHTTFNKKGIMKSHNLIKPMVRTELTYDLLVIDAVPTFETSYLIITPNKNYHDKKDFNQCFMKEWRLTPTSRYFQK